MQIWKSANMFLFIWKNYVKKFTLNTFYYLRYADVRYAQGWFYNVSETLILCHQLAKFGDHRHCVSTAMLVSVCHVILRDHVTEGSSNVMGRSPSKWVAFLLSLMAIDTVSWDIMVLVCNVISQDHLLKRSCDFMGRTPSRYVTILQGLVAIGTVVVELYCF